MPTLLLVGAVLVAAGRVRPPVAGVVSLSGAAEFAGMDARVVVPRLRVPALFMAAKGDGPFPAAHLDRDGR